MTVRALLRDGRELELHPRFGETPEQVADQLKVGALVGSAAPPVDVELESADGEKFSYADVNRLA